MTKVRKAIFPVGGLGTRFLPATKAMPKEMLAVVDKPLIQYAVEEAQAAGIEELIFVTGKGKTAIEDHFDHSLELEATLKARGKEAEFDQIHDMIPTAGNICYIRQQEPLGLGHAVWCARHLIHDEPFAVLLADDFIFGGTPCLKQMVAAHAQTGGSMVAIENVPAAHTSRYGIIQPKPDGFTDRLVSVAGMVEKPAPEAAPSTLAIIGRYILEPQVFDYLEKHQKGAGGEIQLTDALVPLIDQAPFHGYRFEGQRFDCGSKLGLLAASLHVALGRDDLKEGLQSAIEALVVKDLHKAA